MDRRGITFGTVVVAVLIAVAPVELQARECGGESADAHARYPWKEAVRFERLRVALDDGVLPTVGLVSGVSIDPTWAIGVGVEYDRYDEADAVPLFLHLRVTPKGGEIGHLVFVEAGYCLLWIDGTPGTAGSGPFARGGMGRRVGHLFGSDVFLSLSFRIQASEAYAERTGLTDSTLTRFAVAVEIGL